VTLRAGRWARSLVGATIAGAALLAGASLAPAQTTSTTAPSGGSSSGPGLTLTGGGSNGPYKELTTWQNDLSGAQNPINLQYTPTGTLQGRDDMIAGTSDFALSGTQFNSGSGPGFTASEIDQLPHKNLGRDVIAAPVQVSALAFVLAPPHGQFSRIDQFDATGQQQPFISPVVRQARIPWPNLASMLLNVDIPDPSPPDTWTGSSTFSWDAAPTLAAFGVNPPQCDFGQPTFHCFAAIGPGDHPAGVTQSEADESNYYMQLAFEQMAPTIWTANQAANTAVKWQDSTGDVSERMPRQPQLSRQGADQAGDQLTLPGSAGGFPPSGPIEGAIGTLPPSAKTAALLGATASTSPLEFVAVRNANNDWVEPTPTTIDNAVNAGSQPFYALTHNVANAYPLTWVNYLYVKSTGLSATKTEAIATLIRYLATDGQAAAAPWGEGTLSPALAAQALNAANQVVQSNCPAAGGQIVKNSSPGADAPNLSGINAIGPMLHCVAPPSAPAGAGSGNSPSGFGGLTLPGLTPTAPSAPTSTPAAAVKAPAASLPDALSVAKLPIPLPGTPIDRIVAVLLGGVAYLALRDPIRRMLGRAVE
jgi:ABC-type phosphate transport system substrate-binding protein